MQEFSISLQPSIISPSEYGLRKVITGRSIQSYNHVISAFGGYDTASVTIFVRKKEIDDFLFAILGNTIRVVSGETNKIWEGFVNEINLTYNGNDITVGPLMDIANKVLVRYTDYVTGVPGTTTYSNSLISQDRYGVMTKILAGISVSITNANNIRDHYLNENEFPAYNIALTIQESGDSLSVTLNCLGFYHILNTYVYNNPLSGSYTVREKIIDILEAHPNSLFKRTGLIEENTLSVLKLEDEDRLAIDVIKELIGLGSDSNNDRMTFGIYDDLSVEYKQITRDIIYNYRNDGNSKNIFNSAHGKAELSSIRPGVYIGIDDIPDVISASRESQPKAIFAETINYTAPFGLSVTGSSVSTLAQKLAKLGLGGLS